MQISKELNEKIEKYGLRESMDYDVVIIGAGLAGLSTAIKLKQLALKNDQEISIVILEKGSEVGSHILSGAVMDTKSLSELIPDWQNTDIPIKQKVTQDEFLFLTENSSFKIPSWTLPKCFHNNGNFIVRLGFVAKWLADFAENLGIEIFPNFAATEILYDNENKKVKGIATGNFGINKNGEISNDFQLGMEINAKFTVFSEGSRGNLGKQIIEKFNLDKNKNSQSYSLGIKELWEIDPKKYQAGLVIHTAGFPLQSDTYGGGFLYHLEDNLISLGLIVGLDYQNPYLSPFEEMQKWKTQPKIKYFLESARRISYGARTITAGGILALPKLSFPGGVLVGCDAGFLNSSRIKGSHSAIKSGILAAESIFESLKNKSEESKDLNYEENFRNSWLYNELWKSRNFKTWFNHGLYFASFMTGIEQFLFQGKIPWTLRKNQADHSKIKLAQNCEKINYSKPDNQITFDRLSSIYLSNVNHNENQPSHLALKDKNLPNEINFQNYAGLEQNYCPAGVYEFIDEKLQINAQNCVHCKTCDIKDPNQNINWTPPEGGGGPNYVGM